MPSAITDTASQATVQLLTALQWPQLGTATLRDLATRPETADASNLRDLVARWFPRVPLPSLTEEAAAWERVRVLLDRCAALGISVLSLRDAAYPARLRAIADAPPLLYVRGAIGVLSRPAVAVVGTRQASPIGLRAAHAIALVLVRHGYVVVSGLALGVDTAGHEGALEGGGATVAVLAHGLHTIAPTSNKGLAERILAGGGTLVAEHPPGMPPRPAEFVRRNRIQSGLSLASVVVESNREGGAMHQARFTRDQGRALYAVVPAAGGDFRRDGAELLVRELGATPVRTTGELLDALRTVATEPPAPLGTQHPLFEFR